MSLSAPASSDACLAASNIGGACAFIRIGSLGPGSETLEAFGVSSLTKKSKTLTGSWAGRGTAEGGEGASGGALTRATAALEPASGTSSTYAFRGRELVEEASIILTDFLGVFVGL